jgi:1-phosphofructokinase family hexose kinase
VILTVTLNAALDTTYAVDLLTAGEVNPVTHVCTQAGGKGINVARVLRMLGHEAVITGLAGGPTGAAIRADLSDAGLPESLVPVAGDARRTVTVVEDGGLPTAFHERGPTIAPAEWARFLSMYRDLAARAAIVVLSGSLPPGVPRDAYAELIRLAPAAQTIVDTSGVPLELAVAAGPDVVKPNRSELVTTTGIMDPLEAALRLRDGGAHAVVASLGDAGLLALTPDGDWRARPPESVEGNPTGAGDACVAVLAAGLANGIPWRELLVQAVAVSAAAVACPVAGGFDTPTYGRLKRGVVLEEPHADTDR